MPLGKRERTHSGAVAARRRERKRKVKMPRAKGKEDHARSLKLSIYHWEMVKRLIA